MFELRFIKRTFGVLSVLLVTGSIVLFGVPASPAGAISNGTSIATAEPWSALVTQANFNWLGIQSGWDEQCTGTLIAKAWVLTASHCVESSKKATYGQAVKPSVMRVVLGRDHILSDSGGIQYTVSQILPGPGFFASSPETSDYALLHLNENGNHPLPAGAAPMPLVPSNYTVPNGTGVSFLGYGLLNPYLQPDFSWYGTAMQTDELQETVSGSYVRDSSCDVQTFLCFDYTAGSSMVEHGDSGGPVVVDPSDPDLLGVTDYLGGYDPVSSGYGYALTMHDTSMADPSIHSWIDDHAGIPSYAVGKILRIASTGQSWLIEADGYRHSIPDGGTYKCLTRTGHAVAGVDAFDVNEVPLSNVSATCAKVGSKSNILIYGDGDSDEDPSYSSFSTLASALTSIGFRVTTMPGTTALPADIGSYGQIWFDGIDQTSAADQQTLESYVENGGSVYLTGDWGSPGNFNNGPDANIIDAVLNEPISVSGDAENVSGLSVNTSVIDGAATNPNVLTTWEPSEVGALSGVAPDNVLFADSGGASGALWQVGKSGRLAILMDVNWAETPYEDTATMPEVAQNIGYFLSK